MLNQVLSKNPHSPALLRDDGLPVAWRIADGLVSYPDALAEMTARAAAIAEGAAGELAWLVEHPPLYTAGTSAKPADLLEPERFPVFPAGRGGQFTYHGPGQRVVYVMLDLRARGRDIHQLVAGLEAWLIGTLGRFNIDAFTVNGRVGVWVNRPDKGPGRADKIAAIGIRVSRWVSFHGISLNVNPDLGHFSGIVPCGISDQGVTSFEDLGHLVDLPEVDMALRAEFEHHFGPTRTDHPAGTGGVL